MAKDLEGKQRIKAELEKDTRDVADLWSDALRAYKGIVGTDLQRKFATVDDMKAFGVQEMNAFHSFRHNQKKVDKLRSLFMANIGYIEQGAQQLVAAATPAFPPAAAIGTALTYMLSACKGVSADYDVVNAFFEDMNAFLQRITILESRLPSYPAYRNCLMDVFTSILKMCGFATKYIELGRMKKWVINMIKGEDSELGGARKSMDTSLLRLQSATEYAILSNTEEGNRMAVELQQNQELQTELINNQTKMLEAVLEHQESVKNDLKNIQKLLVMFDQQHREEQPKKASKAASKNKPATSHRVRSFFEATSNLSHEYRNVKERLLPDTCQWLFAEDEWSWFTAIEAGQQESLPILAIQGEAGLGKSHLAIAAYDTLVKSASTDVCVVNFFFRDQSTTDLSVFCNAVNWAVIQIAEQSAALCERLNVEIQREDLDFDIDDWKNVWNHLVVPLFPKDAPVRLQIVWDGLDELTFVQKHELIEFLKEVRGDGNSNISLVCTTRPDNQIDGALQDANARYIHVVPAMQVADKQTLVWSHLNNNDGLKRFSKFAKQTIVSTLADVVEGDLSYSLLYCEHILRQFNSIGREHLVLKHLRALPADWPALYKIMLDDLHAHTPVVELPAMKLLFKWIAFSDRAMSLDECLGLLKLGGYGSFDLERELQGNSLSRFLRIAAAEERVSAELSDDAPALNLLGITESYQMTSSDDGDHPLRFHDRSTRGFFAVDIVDEHDLRTPKGQAHREIFAFCAEVLCGKFEAVHKGLRAYAASEWMYHLSWSEVDALAEADQVVLMTSVAAIMTDQGNIVASTFEELNVDYDEQLYAFPDELFMENMHFFAKVGVQLGAKLPPGALAFYQEVAAKLSHSFVPLAKAHVANWLSAGDVTTMLRSYKFARQCIKLTSHKDLLVQGDDDDDPSEDDEIFQYDEDEILAIFNTFSNPERDGQAYLALSALLGEHIHYVEARDNAQQAVELLPNGPKRSEALLILASAYLGIDEYVQATNAVNEVLGQIDASPKLRRRAFMTLAKIQKATVDRDDAAKSYQQARQADPDEPVPGDDLSDEFYLYLEQGADAKLLELVTSWKATEKLTLMTWKYDGSGHSEFFRAAGRCGKMDTAIQNYEEVIKLLDTVDAAAPMRYQLARAKWYISGDAEGAKALLNETLDSTTDGTVLKFTNEDPSYSLVAAILLMADLIFEQYRMSSDRAFKAQLFAEIKGLTSRPLAQSIAPSKSDLHHHTVVVAKMARKMGTAMEFQDTLQSAFDACYEALIDNVGWNDWLNLMNMASIVSQLDGLEREAEILVSAQFSQLDPDNVDNDKEGSESQDDADGDEDDGDEEEANDEEEADDEGDDNDFNDYTTYGKPDDEGDLSSAWTNCLGDCHPNIEWEYWANRPMYICLVCADTTLCEACYQKRQTYNVDRSKCPVAPAPGPYFCGWDHQYVKGPVEGWKGVTGGVMRIEGEEEDVEVEFKVWLEELRNDKWVRAWERFWLRE